MDFISKILDIFDRYTKSKKEKKQAAVQIEGLLVEMLCLHADFEDGVKSKLISENIINKLESRNNVDSNQYREACAYNSLAHDLLDNNFLGDFLSKCDVLEQLISNHFYTGLPDFRRVKEMIVNRRIQLLKYPHESNPHENDNFQENLANELSKLRSVIQS